MREVHTILGIDPRRFNQSVLERLNIIYSNTEIHTSFVGPNIRNAKKFVTDDKSVTSNLGVNAITYNYSFAINLILKRLYDQLEDKETPIALTDSWTLFSVVQPIAYEFKKFDFSENFIKVRILFDKEEKLSLETNKIMTGLIQRTKNILSSPYEESVPCIITSLSSIIDICNGLEEELFTECSRIHLINQLKKAGLHEHVSENFGLKVGPLEIDYQEQKVIDRDKEIIDEISTRVDHAVFIPNNLNVSWGEVEKIDSLKLDGKKMPIWKSKFKSPIKRIRTKDEVIRPEIKELSVKEEEIMLETNGQEQNNRSNIAVEIVDERVEHFSDLDTVRPVLIMVSSIVKDLMCITPLIKEAYRICKFVDILTDDKIEPTIPLIKNFMIRNVYGFIDYQLKNIDLNQYGRNIIKTIGCEFKIERTVILPRQNLKFQPYSNYSTVDTNTLRMPFPYACYREPRKIIPPNTITIGISIRKKSLGKKPWDNFSALISKLTNERNMNIIVISLINEIKTISTEPFNIRKNVLCIDNSGPMEASGIIRNSDLFICHPESDLSWISYGLKKNTLLLEYDDKDPSEIPECKWIHRIKIINDTRFDELALEAWRKL